MNKLPITEETKKLIKKEIAVTKKLLSKLTPKAWLAQVESIQDYETRVRVANIVYWDWFGDRPSDKRWSELDEYLTLFKSVNSKNVETEKEIFAEQDRFKKARMKLSHDKTLEAQMQKVKTALLSIGYSELYVNERARVIRSQEETEVRSNVLD